MKIHSILFKNYEGSLVDVICDTHAGFPGFDILYGTKISQNSVIAEKLRTSMRNQDFIFPKGSVVVEISPYIPQVKTDELDLAIILSILLAKSTSQKKILAIGNVNIKGEISAYNINLQYIFQVDLAGLRSQYAQTAIL